MQKPSFLIGTLLLANACFAQNSIFSGRVVDEHNKPLQGAEITVRKGRTVTKTSANDDGLFYTQLLPSGYYHVGVYTGDKLLKTTVYLPDETKKKCYYYLAVAGGQLRVRVDGQDPFLKARLAKMEDEEPRNIIDMRGMIMMMKMDATGNGHNLYGSMPYIPTMENFR